MLSKTPSRFFFPTHCKPFLTFRTPVHALRVHLRWAQVAWLEFSSTYLSVEGCLDIPSEIRPPKKSCKNIDADINEERFFLIPVNSALNTNSNTNLTFWLDFYFRASFVAFLGAMFFFVWECHIGRFFSVLALQKSGRVNKHGLNVIVIDTP